MTTSAPPRYFRNGDLWESSGGKLWLVRWVSPDQMALLVSANGRMATMLRHRLPGLGWAFVSANNAGARPTSDPGNS